MNRELPTRFWIEAVTAAIGAVLFGLTLANPEWIESLTGLEPDGGGGALEVAITMAFFAISTASALAARRTFHRAA